MNASSKSESFLLNNGISRFFEDIGNNVILLYQTLRYFPLAPTQLKRIVEQCYLMGLSTIPIVAILSFFIGAVLALQTGFVLSQLGAVEFIGAIVGLSMCREMAPVMVAFLLAGRVGSAVTAELASMKVYSEVDALKVMNVPAEKILVMPRLVAALLIMPILNIIATTIGWMGGMLVSKFINFIQLAPHIYWRNLKDFTVFPDIIDGTIKAEVFGFAVVLIACNQGLVTTGGPREIGSSVTKSVVTSMVFILLTDFFITRAQL
ncbi:MAG: ABC transporter permease [Opitutales bacterium]|nr:ABC transporter permease [Opitutales bacterium]